MRLTTICTRGFVALDGGEPAWKTQNHRVGVSLMLATDCRARGWFMPAIGALTQAPGKSGILKFSGTRSLFLNKPFRLFSLRSNSFLEVTGIGWP